MLQIGDRALSTLIPKRTMFSKGDFHIYSCEVKDVQVGFLLKHKIYNTVTIKGEFQELELDTEYECETTYQGENKYGHQYEVVRISRPTPTTPTQIKNFLSEIISAKRAEQLVNKYPDIIDRVLNDKEIDCSLLEGIGEKTLEKIKDKIRSNIGVMEIHKEYGQYGLTFSILKKMLYTYGSVDMVKYKIKKEPYKTLTNIKGIGFKKADEIALSINKDLECSLERMIGCILFFLEEYENMGHTYIDMNNLYSECINLVEKSIEYFNVALEDELIFYDEETQRVSRSTTRRKEEFIANKLIEMQNNNIVYDVFDFEKYRNLGEFTITDEQTNVLKEIATNNVVCLTAPAGSGKSSCIKALTNMLEDLQKDIPENYEETPNLQTYLYCLTTPTAKASDVLSDYTERNSKTIHRLLGFNGEGFSYNEKNKLKCDVLIVDEFSMVNISLFVSLLKAIDTTKTKILLVFDEYQLASIGCGNIAHDIIESGVFPVCRLTKIFRYNEGGLMQIATKVRNSEKFLESAFEGVKVFGANRDYCYVEINQEIIVDKTLQYYKKLLDSGNTIEDIMVITAKNVGKYGTKILNTKIQEMLQKGKNNEYTTYGETKFYVGDKVKQTKNNYRIEKYTPYMDDGEPEWNGFNDLDLNEEDKPKNTGEVYNGTTGIVEQVFNNMIYVKFKNDVFIYRKDELSQLDLGYAITAHSSQGSGCKNIILLTPRADTYMLNSNLIYVGITRAKKRVYHLGNIATVNSSIKKKENLTRQTYLCEMLKELNNQNKKLKL